MTERYLATHEWARTEGAEIVCGISAFAAGELGDVIHVELPAVGDTVRRGVACGEIESVKSVSDFYSPVDGKVVAINTALGDRPELVNGDPLGIGWFLRIRPVGADPLAGLLSADDYAARVHA